MDADATSMESLRRILSAAPQGPLVDEVSGAVLQALAACWDEIAGASETEMAAYKLDRATGLSWEPPLLSFEIDRHGGIVGGGSSRAERQRWTVDIAAASASQVVFGYRQVRPNSPKLDVQPIAAAIAEAVQGGNDHPHIKWRADGSARLLPSAAIPPGPKQTQTNRRKRLRAALNELLGDGWEKRRWRDPA